MYVLGFEYRTPLSFVAFKVRAVSKLRAHLGPILPG